MNRCSPCTTRCSSMPTDGVLHQGGHRLEGDHDRERRRRRRLRRTATRWRRRTRAILLAVTGVRRRSAGRSGRRGMRRLAWRANASGVPDTRRRTTAPGGRPGPLGRCGRETTSAGLAVRGVLAAARAELLQLHAVGVVAPVLLGDVVALLALRAGKVILGRTSELLLATGCLSSCRILRVVCQSARRCKPGAGLSSGGGTRTRDTTIMSRVL